MAQEQKETSQKPQARKLSLIDLTLAFLMPMLVGKSFVMYFGLKYAEYPGRGYGYKLAAALCFTLFMIGRFLWRYRHHKEE